MNQGQQWESLVRQFLKLAKKEISRDDFFSEFKLTSEEYLSMTKSFLSDYESWLSGKHPEAIKALPSIIMTKE